MITPNERLKRIKLAMQGMGWSNGGEPGAVKLGLSGEILADAGSQLWQEDLERAIAQVDGSGLFHEGRPGSDVSKSLIHPVDRRAAG